MRGLMANPKGEIIERPIKSNFVEGLDVLEYFISTHGARKGLADTALRTADSGYLTRRLGDVAQDVIIRLRTAAPISTWSCRAQEDGRAERDAGRALRGRRRQGGRSKNVLVEERSEIGRADLATLIEAFDVEKDAKIPVRSVLKCEARPGFCQACYGRSLASGVTAQIGDAVGIIAAQSIGEPGTQLTMRTFHTGGSPARTSRTACRASSELFEARKPKGLAKIAKVAGIVSLEPGDRDLKVVITDDAGEEHREAFPPRTILKVTEGQRVEMGDQISEGNLYPHDLLEYGGHTQEARRTRTERYWSRASRRSIAHRASTSTTSTSRSSCAR
jgi:DNA-directed RNA polymerase subunit beta'